MDDILACLTIPSLRVLLDVKTAHVRCNWKIMAEGFLEVYHARTVHPATVAPTLSTKGTVITLYPHGHQSMVSPVVPGARTDGRDQLPMFEGASAAFQAMLQPAHGIFPNLITPLDGRGFPFLVFWPEAIDQTRLDIIWFVPDWGEGELPDKELWDRRLERFDVLMQEDYRNAEPIQRSMEHAAHGGQVINYQERRIWHVHAWIDKTIGPERIPAELCACPTCWRTGTTCHEAERSALAGSGVVALQPAALRRLRRSHGRAAAAGFAGIGLYAQAYERMRDEGRKAADIAFAVTDHGLALAEVETVKGWWATQGPLADECLATEQLAYELADAAGVRYLQAIGQYECSIDQAAHGFAGLCESRRGARLEGGHRVVAVHQHRSAAEAQRIVEAADRPENGGYCADIWHHVRGANDIEMVRQLPADKIFAVQMNDGPARPLIDDYKADCLASRLPPGDGTFDCVGFVRTLVEMGVTAPISLPVCSQELWAAPVDHAAKVAADGMRQVLAQVS